jgi:hypothetical protein
MRGTALQVVQQAASELGLPRPVAAMTSPEQTLIQMWALLNSCGNELCLYHDWQYLRRVQSIVGVDGQTLYPRPDDFSHQINQTIWDKASQRPVAGPISPQGWAVIKNSAISTGPFMRYRITEDSVELNPAPPPGESVNYEYVSNGWVQRNLDPNMFVAFITSDADILLHDFWLLVRFLKLKMWEAKGLETTNLMSDFSRTFNALLGYDSGAPVLSLSPRAGMPWLTPHNIPEGNWNV